MRVTGVMFTYLAVPCGDLYNCLTTDAKLPFIYMCKFAGIPKW
jgi:hypothetical protein